MPAPTGDQLNAVLDKMPVARLALQGLDGQAEVLAIVLARAAGALWSPIDGKPKRSGRKLARLACIEREPCTMLLFDHYDADWQQLWWVRLRCAANVVTPTHPGWPAAVAALAAKYPQYQTVPMFKDAPRMLRFTWEEVSVWSATAAALPRWMAGQLGAIA